VSSDHAVVTDVLTHFAAVVVGVVIKLRSGRSGVRIPAGFYPLQNVQPCSGTHPTCSIVGTGVLSWGKAAGS